MNKEIVEQSIESLKQSPLFAMSLSGTELAHSNFWAWLIKQKDEQNKHPYIEVFMPKFYENEFIFLDVQREKGNMDLTIKYKDSANKELIYVVENKIKSIPGADQLRKYQANLDKNHKFGGGVLTGLSETLSLECLDGWLFLSYEEIGKRILEIHQKNNNQSYADIIKQYANDILQLSFLIQNEIRRTKNTYVYTATELEEIRFADIFIKLKGSEFVKKINEELVRSKHFTDFGHWRKPTAEFSFNNKKPTITIVYKELVSGTDSSEEYGRLGVQIEGDAFRIYGGGSKFGINLEEDVLEAMKKVGYLVNDFDKTVPYTRMKKDHCGYRNNDYCYLYQYWNITKRNYAFLIQEILEQLEIAKEKIEGGFTFKK